jgi:hypothetical protein
MTTNQGITLDEHAKLLEVFNAQKRMQEGGPGTENVFFCDGRIMMGPAKKVWQPIVTANLVGFPVGLFICFEAPTLPMAGDVNVMMLIAIVLGLISLLSLFMCSVSDPGVLLRVQDPAIAAERDRRDMDFSWRWQPSSAPTQVRFHRTCSVDACWLD